MTGSENIWRLDDFQKHLFRGPTQPDIQVLRKECREGNLSHAASKIGKHWWIDITKVGHGESLLEGLR